MTLLLLLLALALPAAAQQSTTVDYEAVAQCPEREIFLQEVYRRLDANEPLAELGTVSVRITGDTNLFRGELRLIDAEGRSATRRVESTSCDEVASALALIAALALQAKLALDDDVPSEASETPVTAPPVSEEPAPSPEPSPAEPAPSHSSSDVSLGLHLGAASAYSPDASVHARAFVSTSSGALALRGWVGYGASLKAENTVGSASFDWFGGRGDLCALAGHGETTRAGMCGTFELGYLRGNGQPTGRAQTTHNGVIWLAPGLSALLVQPLAGALRLELTGGAQFPLYREQFIFRRLDGSSELIHRVPWAGWMASVGVAYRLR